MGIRKEGSIVERRARSLGVAEQDAGLGRWAKRVEFLDRIENELRVISDVGEQFVGELEPLRRIAYCLQSSHCRRCEMPRQDVQLIFRINPAEVWQQRGLPRERPLELTREQGLV